MHAVLVLAITWPGAGSASPVGSPAFWAHQAVAALASLLFLRWVAWLAARRPRDQTARVLPFPRRP